jgi:hypothetical protein
VLLALDDDGAEHGAAILGHHVAQDLQRAGLDIHLDLAGMRI